MKIEQLDPPREYQCGYGPVVTMRDCAHIQLQPDEQVTLETEQGGEYDVARKSWGFYATPSINGRLAQFGFATALVRNRDGRYFVMLVEQGKQAEFDQYVLEEGLTVCGWLDQRSLEAVERALQECGDQ